eukprot:Em0003g210a
MALAMALTRVTFSLPNMLLITLALRNEEEPKAKRVASRVKVLLASSPQLHFSSSTHVLASAKIAGVRGDVTVMSKAAGLPCAQSLTSTSAGLVRSSPGVRPLPASNPCCNGISIIEQYLQPIWRELVEKLPLWMAPNLITFTGLMVNLASTVFIVAQDPNGEGKHFLGKRNRSQVMGETNARPYGLGYGEKLGREGGEELPLGPTSLRPSASSVYQTLDALDGKQARRTGSANPLGELFDHGCDAVSTYLVALCGVSSIGLAPYPMVAVFFVVLLLELNFCYHWQTYVCGKLYFYSVDVTEGQYTSMAVLIIAGLTGIILGTITFSLLNYINVFKVILSRGAGKNGSTVADTSVVSPIITPLILTPMVFIYASMSPGHVIENHLMLFLCALTLPIVKTTILMMLAGMTKSPFPLLDTIMLGPFLAICNLYLGELVPEYYVMWLLACHPSSHTAAALGETVGVLTAEKVVVPPGSEMELMVKQTSGANGGTWFVESDVSSRLGVIVAMSQQKWPGSRVHLAKMELIDDDCTFDVSAISKKSNLSQEDQSTLWKMVCESGNYTSDAEKEQLGELGRTAVMKHHINTGYAQPVHLLPRRIPQARRDEVKRLIREMLNQGAIQHSDSPCNETYPIHAVFNSHPAQSQGAGPSSWSPPPRRDPHVVMFSTTMVSGETHVGMISTTMVSGETHVSMITTTMVSGETHVSMFSTTMVSGETHVSMITTTMVSGETHVGMIFTTMVSGETHVSMFSTTMVSGETHVGMISTTMVSGETMSA